MSMIHVMGDTYALARIENTENSNGGEGINYVYEGPYEVLEAKKAELASDKPSGYYYDNLRLSADGKGGGTLVVSFVKEGDGNIQSATPERTTFTVEMAEVTKDLMDHPHLDEAARDYALLWVNSGCIAERSGGNVTYYYKDEDGERQEINYQPTIDFCDAYTKGIKTYQEFYPVVRKVSFWKALPGASTNGRDVTGGTVKFSTVGTFDNPPLKPAGYNDPNKWYKSRHTWEQQADKTWRCTEEWTYTPDGADSDVGWIYDNSNAEDDE